MNREWELSIGTIPGFIIGVRTYPDQTRTNHVLYLIFVSVCLTIYNKRQ